MSGTNTCILHYIAAHIHRKRESIDNIFLSIIIDCTLLLQLQLFTNSYLAGHLHYHTGLKM